MTTGSASRDRMLARLDAYATLRDDGIVPGLAAQAMDLSESTAARYERWYRAHTGQPPRQPGFGEPMPQSSVRGVFQ